MILNAGVDIGGTNTVFGWVTAEGNCIWRGQVSTKDYLEADTLAKEVCKLLQDKLPNKATAMGIGVGAPNGNYYNGTIEFAPNLSWKGIIPLKELFEKHSKLPTVVGNDANCAAMGEMIYGGASGMKDFMLITLGTGLGSGYVINGEVLYGHDSFAGELGHIIVEEEGRLCGCGRKGCLETYVSASGIVRTANKLLKENEQESSLRGLIEIESKDIAEAAESGDALALLAFDLTAKKLGLALANSVAITSPQAIFLFGGLAKSGNLILVPTKKYMEINMLNIFKNKVEIKLSSLDNEDAAILGASALAKNEFSEL